MTSDHRSSSAGAASAAQQPPLQDDSLSLLTSILSHTFNVSNSYPISSSLSAVAVPPPPRPENNLTRQPIKAVMATALSQETRRRRALADQKKRREDLIAKTRKIAQVAVADDDSSGDEEDLTCIKMQMDISTTKDSSSSKPVIKASMSNQLMEHEVMVDAPRDLTTNWMLMMLPYGTRCVVVSNKGVTAAYTQTGELVEKFQSSLPGGSICDSGKRRLYCILDAIIDKDTQRLFILDILCWNSQPVYECDSEFRNYWRMSKLAEVDVFRIHAQNKFAFQIVESFDTSVGKMKSIFCQDPSTYPYTVDKILFVNKETHYVIGQPNPLCCWLKAPPSDHVLVVLKQILK